MREGAEKKEAEKEETPAEVKRSLEKEIKTLEQRRETTLHESGRMLEMYMETKAPDLPEKSLVLKKCIKKNFSK